MNVLLLTAEFPPEIRSAALLMAELAGSMARRGHRVTEYCDKVAPPHEFVSRPMSHPRKYMNSRLTTGKRCRLRKMSVLAAMPFLIQGFLGWLRFILCLANCTARRAACPISSGESSSEARAVPQKNRQ